MWRTESSSTGRATRGCSSCDARMLLSLSGSPSGFYSSCSEDQLLTVREKGEEKGGRIKEKGEENGCRMKERRR